jgi:lipopolysaccharide/colanic/teichoic acid biosynthesis glycosyltransferase
VIEAKTDEISWSKITAETVRRTRFTEPQVSLYPRAKRWVDVICSAALLVLLSPVMALIALAIRLDSSGPAIFRQKRVGQWGKQFIMFKFRSMHANADEKVHRQFASDYINGNGHKKNGTSSGGDEVVYKPNGDKRITRVGRWLRRTSLDELPQLFNVLRGEMSLVGPRPAVPYEVDEYSKWHLHRLTVMPGLTGLAQVSGRSGLTFEKIVRIDLVYVRRRSLALDLAILLRTIPVVLRADSAA